MSLLDEIVSAARLSHKGAASLAARVTLSDVGIAGTKPTGNSSLVGGKH